MKHKAELLEEFSDVFSSTEGLPTMKGEPMKIHLKEGATPSAIYTCRQIPFKLKEEVKNTLDTMVKNNIIRPITDTPSDWCHPLVIVPKKNNKLRLCVDLTKLNKHVKRPVYPTMTPKEAVSSIDSDSRYFTTLDMSQGYHQIQLHEESQILTTFLTPWGRYYFIRAPMGLSSTGDEFSHRGDEAIQGMQNVKKVVDDMLVHDEKYDDHFHRVRQLLLKCREKCITLNPEKFTFAEEKVKYVGYLITSKGVEADPDKI